MGAVWKMLSEQMNDPSETVTKSVTGSASCWATASEPRGIITRPIDSLTEVCRQIAKGDEGHHCLFSAPSLRQRDFLHR